ncbi:MAG: hydrogenase-4 component G, partial [Desulfobacteraceae bacterium]|nr:hydrogenase-4 component G [Desulfobacteraceae bacterium]
KNISNHSIKKEIFQFSSQIKADTGQNLSDQNAIFHFNQLNKGDKALLVYNGTPISELSFDEANELIGTDGYFGIAKTSQRIIDFVIKGAGDDIDRLKAGREGVLRGFAAAEKAWGGSLPGICCQTIDQTIKALDDRIAELGGNITDITA